MERLLTILAIFVPFVLSAQVAIHFQAGAANTTLAPERDGAQYKAKVGVLAGADLRIGQRAYFQPGAFFVSAKTAVSYGDTLVTEDQLTWNSLKLKALFGYNLLDGDDFRFRANLGSTYNWLLSASGKDENIKVVMDDINTGTWSADAGLGIDVTIFTVDGGVSYGLSNVYKEVEGLSSDARYFTWYATVGVVLGGSTTSGPQ